MKTKQDGRTTEEKRYASKEVLSNLMIRRQEAEASFRNQVAQALSSLGQQTRRPIHMEYYDKIASPGGARADEICTFKSRGGKVVGFFCLFPPIELIRASGAMPVRIDSGVYCGVAPSEQLLSTEACAVVKSSLGAKMLGLSPYTPLCDVVVCPTSCGMKTKLGEVLEDFVPVWRIETPRYKDNSWTRDSWLSEINLLKRNLEKLTGQKVTGEGLRNSIKSAQDARAASHWLRQIRKFKPPPISGRDAMLVTQTSWYDDIERWTRKTLELCAELETRTKEGTTSSSSEAPRIMLAGSPIIWPNWKIPTLIEESGAVIVCDELCSGDQGTLSDSVNVEEWTMKDMMAAIAERYLLPVTCPCFTPNDKRVDKITRMVNDFGIDGVVYHQLRGCYTYKIEFSRIRASLKNLGIPVLDIETDYTHEDIGQLSTRVEAFIEMIQSAKENASERVARHQHGL